MSVSGTYGLEKFAHLEDKIYRTVEQFKRERQERQALEVEMRTLRGDLERATDENARLESHIERLLGERDAIRRRVESMLEAIALLDPALAETRAAVALTGPYLGRPRMTLTFPVLDRARAVLWVVTGPEKVAMLARLARGDRSIPAGRVNSARAVILADAAAAAGLR